MPNGRLQDLLNDKRATQFNNYTCEYCVRQTSSPKPAGVLLNGNIDVEYPKVVFVKVVYQPDNMHQQPEIDFDATYTFPLVNIEELCKDPKSPAKRHTVKYESSFLFLSFFLSYHFPLPLSLFISTGIAPLLWWFTRDLLSPATALVSFG